MNASASELRSYRPANGSEGESFIAKHCAGCACDENTDDPFNDEGKTCPILDKTVALKIDDEGYPAQWVYAADGLPTCTAFVADTGQGWVDPYQVEKDSQRYAALVRDPATGRPVIA